MSAEILRKAASLMRERANEATGPEWAEWHMSDDGRAEVFVPNGTMSTETVFEFKDHMDCEECIRPNDADILHIASWHPGVALAVADSLIVAAVHLESHECEAHCELDGCDFVLAAIRTARTYLGADQ